MKGRPTKYHLLAGGMLVFVAAFIAFVALGVQPQVPERQIPSPAPAFASPVMYVAPGETGQSSGGENEADDSQDAQSDRALDSSQDEQQEAARESDSNTEPGGTNPGRNPSASNPSAPRNPSAPLNPSTPSNPTNPVDPGENPPKPGPSVVIPGIYTNLMNYHTISASTDPPNALALTLEGKSGLSRTTRLLYFYAVPSDDSGGYQVLVEYSNEETDGQKRVLEGSGGLFGLPVVLSDGATTDVTLTLVDSKGARTNRTASYSITYEGRKGPTITLNIEEGQRISSSPFTLLVSARDVDGKVVHSEHMEVTVEGAGRTYPVSGHGSSKQVSYVLDFSSYQLSGDDTTFTVSVRAWDSSIEHASTTEVRSVVYEHHAYGEKIGTATIVIDATTVGLGVVSQFEVDLHQGFPFPQDLVEGLEDQGMTPLYTDTLGDSFYLSGISSGGLFAGQSIPDELMHKIDQDKITFTGRHSSDTLSDTDYTSISGWLYNVNDSWWPSVSLDGYTPTPGDVVYLIYSVAGGKDVGSPSVTGGGVLSSYCGTWRNGTYTESHDLSDYVVVEEPTCGAEGKARYVCSVDGCGAWGSTMGAHADGREIDVPRTDDHSWELDALNSEEPFEGEDGVRVYVCTVCGASKTEVWPWEGPWPPEDDPDPSGGSDDPDPSGGSDDPDPSGGSDDPDPSGGSDDPDPSGGSDDPEPSGGEPEIESANKTLLSMAIQSLRATIFGLDARYATESL